MKLVMTIKGFFYFALLSLSCLKYPEELNYIEVNGQRLLYATRGPETGKPVILLHGNGGSHKSMKTQAKELAKAGYRVYAPDSRGQGANPVLEEYHYADMAEDTYCFIKALKLDKPAVCGWSDGGIIALMLEMAHPGTCGPTVVCGANLYPDCGPDFEEFKTWILEQGTPLAMMMLSEPQIDPADLAAVKCPVLVCAGSKDLISVEHTSLIADSLPDAELAIFEKETHGSYIKKSPKLGLRMMRFLKERNYL